MPGSWLSLRAGTRLFRFVILSLETEPSWLGCGCLSESRLRAPPWRDVLSGLGQEWPNEERPSLDLFLVTLTVRRESICTTTCRRPAIAIAGEALFVTR